MSGLDHPAVQGGVVPLLLALAIAAIMAATGRVGRTPVAWVAVVAGYLASTWLAAGIAFTPLTAGRKIVLVVLVATIVGIAVDLARDLAPADSTAVWRRLDIPFALIAGVAAAWTFLSIIRQREGAQAAGLAIGLAVHAATQCWLVMRSRHDGIRTGAIGVGLGVATGVCAVLSASVGFLMAGVAIGAGAGALLLVQVLGRRHLPAGYTGSLAIALPCALFAQGSVLLAEMPWYVLPLLLVVPAGTALVDPKRFRPMGRASVLVGVTLVLALVPIAAAWYAARGSPP